MTALPTDPIATHRPGVTLRAATRDDVALILAFIRELAEYEREPDAVHADETLLASNLFGATPGAEVVIADVDGRPAGFALFFHNFSTWLGRRGLYLEDLFVRPEFRGRGVGQVLMTHLAKLAVERGCGRFEWSVLDWNTPAIDFYRSLGATGMDEWTVQRLTGEALQKLAAQAGS
ncbi:GNAT family N-acetyltransferase [Lysobacter solisilvae (ex Woo and Kim 2020)]|uniref:GNAT family N-acetyltransferase n=1 Tax=Agrilutibacter terrestris TaxID=2865112 RepID=A0A7H0G0J4_9GAMM|nr:GNAT family N-acetyltransferase [Lysobacter terrestris]QNP41810.1 GNAT family N-acetyltransferase [Lysobacter terrestris]